MAKQPYIIGITGGSASGKSSFAKDLKSRFSDEEMTVLNEDNYYLAKELVPVDNNGWQNYDIPESMDYLLYIEHVKNLRAGNPIQKQEYTFHNPGVTPRLLSYAPAPIIVLEGIFSFHFDEVKDITDLKLYIDADPETRFNRRVKRDFTERGLDLTDVEYRWNNHIKPVFEKNHTEYKKNADLIILNNTNYNNGLQIITAFLKDMLGRSTKL
jgi:uridine kinase